MSNPIRTPQIDRLHDHGCRMAGCLLRSWCPGTGHPGRSPPMLARRRGVKQRSLFITEGVPIVTPPPPPRSSLCNASDSVTVSRPAHEPWWTARWTSGRRGRSALPRRAKEILGHPRCSRSPTAHQIEATSSMQPHPTPDGGTPGRTPGGGTGEEPPDCSMRPSPLHDPPNRFPPSPRSPSRCPTSTRPASGPSPSA